MKDVFITGGTGSVGKILLEHYTTDDKVRKIIIYSRDEYKQAMLKKEFPQGNIRWFIGDIRNFERLNTAMHAMIGVDKKIVIHAAAMKRVEACAYNPTECNDVNVNGTLNVIKASHKNNASKAILVSTDKVVNPVNIYGVSKSMAEHLWLNANTLQKIFAVARFGNILGSRGSIVEVLKNKKLEYITDKDCSRFFTTKKQLLSLINSNLANDLNIMPLQAFTLRDLLLCYNPNRTYKTIDIPDYEKTHEQLYNDHEKYKIHGDPNSLHKYSNHAIIGRLDLFRALEEEKLI